MTPPIKKPKYGRSRSWAVNSDYADKLNPEDKKWLDQFNDEYYRNGFYYKKNTNPIIPRDLAQERAREHYRLSEDAQNISSQLDDTDFENDLAASPEDILIAKEELALAIAAKKERRRVRHNETRRESRQRKKS